VPDCFCCSQKRRVRQESIIKGVRFSLLLRSHCFVIFTGGGTDDFVVPFPSALLRNLMPRKMMSCVGLPVFASETVKPRLCSSLQSSSSAAWHSAASVSAMIRKSFETKGRPPSPLPSGARAGNPHRS
jgi:hypothetical protein